MSDTLKLHNDAGRRQSQGQVQPAKAVRMSVAAAVSRDAAINRLYDACEKGDIEGVKAALAAGAGVNDAPTHGIGTTPLSVAAEKNQIGVMKLLIMKGASLEMGDEDSGGTPLHSAAINGWCEAAEVLLEAGADIDAVDMDGRTPLFNAAEHEEPEMARLLIARGASEEIDGESVLDLVGGDMLDVIQTALEERGDRKVE